MPFARWTRQTIPFVNPTAEFLQLLVRNTNSRNYTVEMDSENTVCAHNLSFSYQIVFYQLILYLCIFI